MQKNYLNHIEPEDPFDPDNPPTEYLVPQIASPASVGWGVGSLSDYFGLPLGIPDLHVDSLWHRAYNLIYNEWYRDENIQDSVVVDKDDGPDNPADYVLRLELIAGFMRL